MSDIWEVAKSMEKEGLEFYKKLSKEAPNKELAGVFAVLAKEEEAHYKLFENLQKGSAVQGGAGNTVAEVKKAFAEMTAEFSKPDVLSGAAEAYRKALSMEQGAVTYYTKVSKGIADKAQLAAVEAIIDEEKRHVRIFESLLDFVARPREWVENAEFNKLEDY
jgi:rubrerythrin